MLRYIQKGTLHPLFQALVFALLIILFLPVRVKKYAAREVEMTTQFDRSQLYFTDLDHDGFSERIHTFFNDAGNVGIVFRTKSIPDNQWNFKGIYQDKSTRFMIGDYNHDGTDEVYLFTLVYDSVMLQGVDFFGRTPRFITDRFIVRLGKNLKDPDFFMLPGKVTDMTGDGSGDLVFGINTGFSRYPRNVFIYDILNDSLISSPKSGAYIVSLDLENLDEDPFPEILLNTSATDNYNKESIPYSDSSSWLMVLDHDLTFQFPPVEFPGRTGNVDAFPVMAGAGGKAVLVGSARYFPSGIRSGKIFVFDKNGNILREKILSAEDPMISISIHPALQGWDETKMIGTMQLSGFFEIDSGFSYKKVSDARFSRRIPDFMDIDMDGEDEIILLDPSHKAHVILRKNFKHPVEIDFPVQSANPLFSVKLNGENDPQLSVQGDLRWKLFDYGINPLYRFRMLIYIGIYLSVLGFIIIIRKLYSIQLKKKYEIEKKISTLQLAGVKAQMEPHFIMNTINTIGSSIYRQKPEEAYQLLLNFSGMVRSLLVSSDKLTRTLKEELDFVMNYLELEKSRFGELFTYSVEQEEGIDPETIVPKMVIQLHVENALKHGLIPKKSGGILNISLKQDQSYLYLFIRDNGIGRKASANKRSESTGKGMKILSQLFETYNRYNPEPIIQEITDLTDEDSRPAGTLVKISVPLAFNEEIY